MAENASERHGLHDASDSDDESDCESCVSEASSIGEGLNTVLRENRFQSDDDGDLSEGEIRSRIEKCADNSDYSDLSDSDCDDGNSAPKLRLYDLATEPHLLGGKRQKGTQRGGVAHGAYRYENGILLDDDYVQPANRSLRPLKVVSETFSWVKEPAREPAPVPFDLGQEPQLLKFSSDASVYEMFTSMWKEPKEVWRRNTNKKGREISASRQRKGRRWSWRDISDWEADVFVAALLRMDVQVKPTLKEYWSRDLMTRDEFVLQLSATCRMSFNRFQKILLATRLHDKKAASCSGASDCRSIRYDTQHKVRPFFDAANKSFQDHRTPGSNVALDESMSKHTGRCGFLQTMPKKPIKKGIKHYYLCESEDGYVYRFLMHSTQTLPYSEEFGYVMAVCMCLLDGLTGPDMITYLNAGRTAYVDRYYTSIPLAKALLDRQTYLVGTIRMGLKCLPNLKELRDGVEVSLTAPDRFPRGATMFRHSADGDMTLTLWMDSKMVPILSTYPALVTEMASCDRRVKGAKTKTQFPRPLVAQLFDEKMGGVDLCDQLIAAQRRHKKTHKWFISVFFRIIDLVCMNVYAIKKRANAKISMRQIKMQLAHDLWKTAEQQCVWKPRPLWTLSKDEIEKGRFVGTHTPKFLKKSEKRICVWCKEKQGNTYCLECHCNMHDQKCWYSHHNEPKRADK